MRNLVATAGQSSELLPGELLDGKYRVIKLLGIGGMGAVYAAKRLALGDVVAIKCILQSQNTEANRARFIREARAVARIRHPHVVQVFDFGEPPGRSPYMVMEYLEGPTLAQVLKEREKLSLDRATWVFSRICGAVEAGHRRGVIHRDLKPGNVILARSDDGRETVKVLDFGLARMTSNPSSMALTNPGSMLGTCSYMAPEQIEGAATGPPADVFSLGVILYEMLTGKLPFAAPTQLATMLRIAEGKFDSPTVHVPGLPDGVVRAIESALSNDPSQRPSSPEALADAAGAGFATPQHVDDMPSTPSRADLESFEANSMAEEATIAEYGPGGEQTLVGEASLASMTSTGPDPDCFVARAEELEQLRREYQDALSGRGRTTVITGDPGVGKTRLLDRFVRWAESAGALVLRGRFFAYEGDRPPPHETFLRMLSARARAGSSGSGEHHAMAHENRPGGLGMDPGEDKWTAFAAMEEAFVERSRNRPVVMAVDDMQWATQLDLEFLSHLARTNKLSIMVVGTARDRGAPTDFTRWLAGLGSQRALSRIQLQPFEEAEVRQWFVSSFGGVRIHPRDIRRLHHATSGNPYYLAEVVRHLVDTQQIVRSDGGWVCASLASVELPDTVNSVVRAKLEGLGEEMVTVLQTAGVIGEEFRFETLQAAVGMEEDDLDELLDKAVKRGILTEKVTSPGSDFRFHSPTLRSVLYGDMSSRRRRRVHKGVVEALQALYGGDAERIAKVLCYHYHATGDWEPTLHWGLVAAAEAIVRHDNDHAEVALRRAREAADGLADAGRPPPPEQMATLDRLTGRLYTTVGRFEDAHEMLRRAIAGAEAVQDRSLRLDSLIDLTECHLGRGATELGVTTGRLAIELAQELEDQGREMAARVIVARCAGPAGFLDDAREVLMPVIGCEDPAYAKWISQGWRELAWVGTRSGSFGEAEAAAKQAYEVARQSGDLHAQYQAVSVQGIVYGEGGDLERSLPFLEQALGLARRLSLRRREGIELFNMGEIQLMLGQLDSALSSLQEALAIFVEVRDRATEGLCRVNLGRVLVDQGRRDDGIAMLETGKAICMEAERSEYGGVALVELGASALEDGRLEQARTQLEEAREMFEEVSSLYLWKAVAGLARVALAAGDLDLARQHADRALELLRSQRAELAHAMDTARIDGQLRDLELLRNQMG